ncbi:MAG TPA: hypothetical protein VGD76_06375, partial [Ramlibacter sp.]
QTCTATGIDGRNQRTDGPERTVRVRAAGLPDRWRGGERQPAAAGRRGVSQQRACAWLLRLCAHCDMHCRGPPTSRQRGGPEDQALPKRFSRTEKKMLLAASLLSSIAQSRLGQWFRAAGDLPRRFARDY